MAIPDFTKSGVLVRYASPITSCQCSKYAVILTPKPIAPPRVNPSGVVVGRWSPHVPIGKYVAHAWNTLGTANETKPLIAQLTQTPEELFSYFPGLDPAHYRVPFRFRERWDGHV